MNKELIEYLGIEIPEDTKFEDLDTSEIKKQINKKFVPINQLKDRPDLLEPIISDTWAGKLKGVESKFISKAKEHLGLEVTHSDFKDLKTEEVIEKIYGLAGEKIASKSDNKEQADKKLMEKIQMLESENTKFKTTLEEKINEFNNYKTEVSEREKNTKINMFENELFGKVKYPAGTKDAMKRGLKAMFNEKYALVPDENGNFELRSRKENTRVYNPDKPTEALNPEKALEILAKENDLWTDSPHDGKENKRPSGKYQAQRRQDTESDVPKRRANPAFLNQGAKV